MRLRILLTVVGLVSAGLAPGARAADAAACEPGAPPDQAAIQGDGWWEPAVTEALVQHEWSMELEAQCNQGTGADVGTYSLGLSGDSTENCAGGTGSGSIDGTGPHGNIYGFLSFERVGIHYYMTGTFLSGGHEHQINLWVDILPTTADACSYEEVRVFGHGMISNTDTSVGGDDAYGCDFRAVNSEEPGTGTGQGAAWGYVAHPGFGDVWIRCYVMVNGAEVSSTPQGGGVAFATTAGRITFGAGETDVVTFCAEAITPRGRFHDCPETERRQIPPQEVLDLINAVAIEYVNPTLCPLLAGSGAGTYGPITVHPDGDVAVDGGPEWDCPPYDWS